MSECFTKSCRQYFEVVWYTGGTDGGKTPKSAWSRLADQIKSFEAEVTATNSFEQAQVCCGGVDTRDVMPETLESRLVPGLYLTGELLDVDGICGGYNLQWAWSSGCLAGIYAGGGCFAH